MTKSEVLFQVAAALPNLTKVVMQQLCPHLPRHWITEELIKTHHLRIPANAVLVNGLKMRVLLGDVVSEHIRAHHCYEPKTVKLVTSLLGPTDVFYDVGAHMGQYTLLAALLCSSVHSFEAVPTTFDFLECNVESNRLANVRVNNCAVSDTRGEVTIHEAREDNLGASSMIAPRLVSGRSFSVPAVSLDEYAATNPPPTVIKIDVEGAEFAVLQGAEQLLRRERPKLILEFSEEHLARFGTTPIEVRSFLTGVGYRFKAINEGLRGFENFLAT